MKTKKIIYSLGLVLFCSILLMTSCKKRRAFNEEDGQASNDNRSVQSENDLATNEINTEVGNNNLLHGRSSNTSGSNAIYGALGISAAGYSVDATNASNGSIQINYNGTTVGNRTRTGSIKLTIIDYASGKRWKDAGCVLKVEFLSYKVTRASDGKSIELNGIQNITNESGSSWFELIFLPTHPNIVTSVTGTNLNVTFDGDKTAVYNINRRFTYSYPNGILTCTGEGIGVNNNLGNLENYGTTRDGDAFTSQVTTPIVWNWTCGWYAPVQGAVNIKVDSKDFDLKVLFSVDASGNSVVAQANSCPYGYKVEWKFRNRTKNKVIGYN